MKVNKIDVSRLVSCYDGDTFRVDIDSWPKLFGYKIPVRIKGINCFERKSKVPAEKALAEQARDFTRTKLMNAKKIVLLNVERDKYFRLLADVEIEGQDLASALLRDGLATTYKV